MRHLTMALTVNMFPGELTLANLPAYHLCCRYGKVKLSQLQPPPNPLYTLITTTARFRQQLPYSDPAEKKYLHRGKETRPSKCLALN